MKRQLLRWIAMLVIVAMAVSAAACAVPSDDGDDTEKRPPSTNAGTSTGAPTETEYVDPHADPGLPSVNYHNTDFRIMAEENVSNGDRARDVVYNEDIASNTINEAVHDRNVYIEDKYGVNIVGSFGKSEDMPQLVARNIASGDRFVEAVECDLYHFASISDAGHLYDLHKLSDYLDLSQPYWDQNCAQSLSLAGALFFETGDIMITDKMGTWSISFNRDLVKYTEGLENLYTVTNTGGWTYEKRYEYMGAVCDYSSHDPTDQFGITWGAVSEKANSYYMWQGCGNGMIGKDENDIPRLNELTESAYDSMKRIATIQYDKTRTLLASDVKGVQSVYFDGTIKIFEEGHSLFFIGSMTIIEWMRAYDTDFGILPMPKADTTQNRYYSAVSNTRSWAYGVPAFTSHTQEDRDFIAIITQALACESTDTLKEAYYDTTLVYQGLRREEDVQMLNLIFDNRVYDLSLVYRWADPLIDQISAAKSDKMVTRLKSLYDTYANSINKAITDFLTSQGLA